MCFGSIRKIRQWSIRKTVNPVRPRRRPESSAMIKQRPAEVRKIYIATAQIEHDRQINRRWEHKYGRLLDKNTEKIGTVNVTKPGWWKDANWDISDEASKPRPLSVLMPSIKYPPRVRRFPPHQEPGPEITDHIPPVSLQYPVPPEQKIPLEEYRGRLEYLKNRWAIPMNKRFVLPPNANWDYGWETLFPKTRDENELPEPYYGIQPVLEREFYRQTGVVNHKESKTRLDMSAR